MIKFLEEGMENGLIKKQTIDLLMKLIRGAIHTALTSIHLQAKYFRNEAVEAISELLLYKILKEE